MRLVDHVGDPEAAQNVVVKHPHAENIRSVRRSEPSSTQANISSASAA